METLGLIATWTVATVPVRSGPRLQGFPCRRGILDGAPASVWPVNGTSARVAAGQGVCKMERKLAHGMICMQNGGPLELHMAISFRSGRSIADKLVR